MHTFSFLLLALSSLPSSSNNQVAKKSHSVGLSYFIVPDKKVSCEDRFPEGLSFFFEQIGGYEENSEVSQVSKILDIDLNAFQNCDQDFEISNTAEEKPFWQNIDSFSLIIDKFLTKIAESPDYYKFVRHMKDHQKYNEKAWRALKVKNKDRAIALLEKVCKEEDAMFPPNTGFLQSNEITRQLKNLKNILSCYKKAGVTKIKLVYA